MKTLSRTPLVLILALAMAWNANALVTLTVNTTAGGDDPQDGALSFTEAIMLLNSNAPTANPYSLARSLSPAEQAQVVGTDYSSAVIKFSIPGAGAHYIQVPSEGFPKLFLGNVLIDGYSQAGASPNSNLISGANNALIKIVLDCRVPAGNNVEGDPVDYTFKIKAPNVHVQGLCVLASRDTDNFGMGFSGGSTNGWISGCWFGISPDQTIYAGCEVAMSSYANDGGHTFGTDGDGVNDRAEFNVVVAHSIGLQFEDCGNLRVSGNFIGINPDGVSVPSDTVWQGLEGDCFEGGGITGTLLIGTDGNGVGDDDERNVMTALPKSNSEAMEWYGPVDDMRFQGNYVGVGADGRTLLLPNFQLINTKWAESGNYYFGAAPGEAINNVLKNRIVGITNSFARISDTGGSGYDASVVMRGNEVRGTIARQFFDLTKSLHGTILGVIDPADFALVTPVLDTNAPIGHIKGTLPLPAVSISDPTNAMVDVYLADSASLPDYPQGALYLGTFVEGGAVDLDPAPGKFDFDVAALHLPTSGLPLVVASTITTHTVSPLGKVDSETSPFSNAAIIKGSITPPRPTLSIGLEGDAVVLTWSEPLYKLQSSPSLGLPQWVDETAASPARIPLTRGSQLFFRLASF